MDMFNSFVAAIILSVAVVQAYPEGPPVHNVSDICSTMMPEHEVGPQTDAVPYTFTLHQTCYKAGDRVGVSIGGFIFEGFFIIARSGGMTDKAYGAFHISENNTSTLSCFGSDKMNAIGHTSHAKQTNMTFYWMPVGSTADIQFTATMVRSYATFWTGVVSDVLRYDPMCGVNMATTKAPLPPISSAPMGAVSHICLSVVTVILTLVSV